MVLREYLLRGVVDVDGDRDPRGQGAEKDFGHALMAKVNPLITK